MDYLNKLPIELWRTIIGFIPTKGSSESLTSTAPLRFLDVKPPLFETAIKSQAYRASLLTICKALKPLVEEWLYLEIILCHRNMIQGRYMAGAYILQSNGRRCGEWTRSVWIYNIPFIVSFAFSCGVSFRDAYPNLKAIHSIGVEYTPNLHQSIMDSSWSVEGLEGITTWTIDHNQLLPYHLQLAAKTFPHLTGLSLLSVGEEAYEGLVHFPCLTRLYLSWEVVSAFPLDKLDMPNLKWLHIEIGTVEGLEYADAFMRRYGPNLIGLQVSTSDFLYSNPTLPGGLFALCENLEVLSIPISKLDAAPRPTEPGAIPHAHLRHLMFIFQCPIGGKKVQQHAASFPTEAFPNLKKVTMIGEEPNTHISLGRSLHSLWEVPEPLDKPMLVHEVAVASFPHAFVELVVERD